MKLKPIVYTTFSLAAFLAPVIVFAVTVLGGGCSSAICGIGYTFLDIINLILVPLLFAVSFIVFLYGIARAYIFSGGDEAARSKGHHLMLWGLIAFAIMISIWGLVNVVANTFGLSGSQAPDLPTSY